MPIELSAAKTKLRVTKADLARQIADMRRLHELSTRLSSHTELPALLQEVLTDVCRLQKAPMGILMLYDAERHDLYRVASVGFEPEYLQRLDRVPIESGLCAAAVSGRKPVVARDMARSNGPESEDPLARLGKYPSVCCVPMYARTGQVVGAIATYFRKPYRPPRHELELVQLYGGQASEFIENARHYQQLREANRMKDEFLATMSHEIRTPLNAVLGWTRVLRAGAVPAEPRTARALESIERNARMQAQLIEDLLDISRIVTGRLRLSLLPVDLTRVVEAAVDVVEPAAENKHLQLALDLTRDVIVFGDADRLQQVVWNLLVNAVRFTPEGGRIAIWLQRDDASARIVVADTGIGIPPAFLPHVFDRFKQGDATAASAREGLGLGLAIVRHLVEAHGGAVRAESPGEGLGATFTVVLPLPAGGVEAAPPVVERSRPPRNALAGRRILLVENEADQRELLAGVLEAHGGTVTAVTSGADAVAALAANPFDVIVADIGMPDMDGYALIRKIRALEADAGAMIPAIAVTVYASARERDAALAVGYDEHIPKPADPDRVVDAILRVLASRSGKKQ